MKKKFVRYLLSFLKMTFKIFVLFLAFVALAFINLPLTRRLSHGKIHPKNEITEIVSYSFQSGSYSDVADAELWTGILPEETIRRLEYVSFNESGHVPLDKILSLSPYPPLYFEIHGDYSPIAVSSLIVKLEDDRLVQLTAVWGEAPVTPSVLVGKVRGEATYFGDHYPTYLFTTDLNPEKPMLLEAEWESYEVAGLEGIREFSAAMLFALLEILLFLGIVIFIHLGKKAAYRQMEREYRFSDSKFIAGFRTITFGPIGEEIRLRGLLWVPAGALSLVGMLFVYRSLSMLLFCLS